MGVKFRIDNRFGDRHVAHGEPLKPRAITTNDIGRASTLRARTRLRAR